MNIDRTNYEQYFLDYLDGNLGEDQAYELFVFLSANPDLEEELMSLKDNVLTLEPEDVSFKKKDELLKRKEDLIVSDNNIEDLLVAKLEKDLSAGDEDQVDKYLELNPDVQSSYTLFEKTVLEPDLSIRFDNKQSLKNKTDLIISDSNIEDLLVAKLENDLSLGNEAQLNKYLELNPDAKRSYELLEKTVLEPDLSIRFDNKQSLKRYVVKKQNSKSWVYYISSAAAAVVLILFSVGILNEQNDDLLKTNTHILPIALNKHIQIKSDPNQNDFAVVGVDKLNIVSNSVNRNESSNETHDKSNTEVVNVKRATFLNDMVKNIKTFTMDDNLAAVNYNVFKDKNNTSVNNATESHAVNENTKPVLSEPDAISMISGEVHNNEYLNELLGQLDVQQSTTETKMNDDEKVTLWDIADFGVNSYNKISGKKISLNREVDKNGKVKTLAINSKKFSFSQSK